MMGSGTTLVECRLLGRRGMGVDINPDAVMVARNRLDFSYAILDADYVAPEVKTYVGDARALTLSKARPSTSSQHILPIPASFPMP
jgi:tRNA G10  N-methylase Trm11